MICPQSQSQVQPGHLPVYVPDAFLPDFCLKPSLAFQMYDFRHSPHLQFKLFDVCYKVLLQHQSFH
ncbi:hypothetical protein GLYMA_13G037700v4 [Glycine max]|uniref:Uncharacterized protein n=1 Tax=Glycine max TaxID=3847 RepID=A0A0R0GIP9_SOYBN|nr:hypothetical protein GYH30_035044 [Glycine max]KRH18103.1 hypothetical protein GLYMA_13G037700v4 [Glycine max]